MIFKKCLKLRSDIAPTNAHEFIKLLNNDNLNFLCWHCHEVYPKCPGYLVDYLMSGDIDDLIELFDIQDKYFDNYKIVYDCWINNGSRFSLPAAVEQELRSG